MERSIIEQHLAQAERHVIEGEARIRRQRDIHRELVRDGHYEAATRAVEVLRQFLEVQIVSVSDRDRLAKALAEAGP